MPDNCSKRRTLLTFAGLSAWVVCCAAGWWALTRYEYTAGEQAQAPLRWPSPSDVGHTVGKSQVVVFVHPRCACTRATLATLADVLRQGEADVDVHVLFYRPASASEGWARTDLWQLAEEIADADVREDVDGVEARRFGARTSGQVLFYDAEGILRLATGVTPSRGHIGDNGGLESLAELISGRASATRQGAVFGCPLGGDHQIVNRMGSDR